jgi:hypothetical protein
MRSGSVLFWQTIRSGGHHGSWWRSGMVGGGWRNGCGKAERVAARSKFKFLSVLFLCRKYLEGQKILVNT